MGFHLPDRSFYLPRAVGQPLVSVPGGWGGGGGRGGEREREREREVVVVGWAGVH